MAEDREDPDPDARRPRPRSSARSSRDPSARASGSAPSKPSSTSRPRPSPNGGLSVARAARLAARQVAELTGRVPEGVVSIEKAEDGWRVSIEVVESHRIPDSADILATYEAELDASGELTGYRRVRRYARGRTQEER